MTPSLQELLKEFDDIWEETKKLPILRNRRSKLKALLTRAYELGVAEAKEQVKAICNKSRTERGLARALGNWIEGEK